MRFLFKKKFLKEPMQLLKLIILLICVVFTIYQLAECIRKIIHPPVSTYYNFNLNDTIKYPCLTICRRPAYKTELFEKRSEEIVTNACEGNCFKFKVLPKQQIDFELLALISVEQISDNLASNFITLVNSESNTETEYGVQPTSALDSQNAFLHFKFENYTIQEFLDGTSYTFNEIFGQYAYAGVGSNPNLTITTSYHLMRGICHTLIPEVQSDTFSIGGGYILYLMHDSATKQIDKYGVSKSGFQIFLHDPNEILTFEDDQKDSFLEYLYLEASEDMRIVINVQTYGRISTNDKPCVSDMNYSKSKCQEYCVHQQVAEKAGCAVPWLLLPENASFPQCSNFISVRDLIIDFRNTRETYLQNCDCPMSCNITIYTTKIVNRIEMDDRNAPNSLISLYYSTNLVTRLNEVIGYDWNQFLADIGGSLGFLLGISVIGLISMIEAICQILFRWMFTKKSQQEEEQQSEELSKENKDPESAKDDGETSGNNVDLKKGKDERTDHSYNNLMDYTFDYSYYEKALVDKAHDKNNKF